MLKLKQIVVSIENSPGRLFEVTHALGNAGINLRALNLVDTGAFGQLQTAGFRCGQSPSTAHGDAYPRHGQRGGRR